MPCLSVVIADKRQGHAVGSRSTMISALAYMPDAGALVVVNGDMDRAEARLRVDDRRDQPHGTGPARCCATGDLDPGLLSAFRIFRMSVSETSATSSISPSRMTVNIGSPAPLAIAPTLALRSAITSGDRALHVGAGELQVDVGQLALDDLDVGFGNGDGLHRAVHLGDWRSWPPFRPGRSEDCRQRSRSCPGSGRVCTGVRPRAAPDFASPSCTLYCASAGFGLGLGRDRAGSSAGAGCRRSAAPRRRLRRRGRPHRLRSERIDRPSTCGCT